MQPDKNYDAVIVGAGHNGLVCGYYLARAGFNVALHEASGVVGGACRTEELVPGYRFSTCANWVGWWRPRIIEDMGLMSRGLDVGGCEIDTRVLPDGTGFTWWPDRERLIGEIRKFAGDDAFRWTEWRSLWDHVASVLGPWLLSYPPTADDFAAEAGGERGVLSTFWERSLADVTDAYFSSEIMRSGIVAPHDVGSLYSKGSAMLMALAEAMAGYSETGHAAPTGYVRGGMGGITAAMAAAATGAGAEIFLNSPVESAVIAEGCVVGVRLGSGETIQTDRIVLGCAPAAALPLLGDAIPPTLRRRLSQLATEVAPLKLHLALNGLPEWRAFPGSDLPYRGRYTLCRTREQSEQAWQAASDGGLPVDPFMVAMTPSFWDSSVAPPGGHTLSVWTLYAPVTPRIGTWEDRREEMLELLLASLEREAPDLRRHLVDALLLTPADIESRVGLPRGNIHHIDLSPSQILWRRPVPELAGYRFPITGVYGCGSSQHPYGEVSGAPGYNAAHAILEDATIVDSTWQEVCRRGGAARL